MSDRRTDTRLSELIGKSDVVHIHGIWQEHCSRTAMLCRRFGKPYVVSAHGMLEPWALRRKAWKKRLYWRTVEQRNLQAAAGLRALTCDEGADYRRLGLLNPVRVIPNGIDLPEQAEPELFLKKFPPLRGQRLVLFLGRLHAKKGLDILCRAWARLQSQFPDTQLVIAGPDEDGTLARIEGLAREAALSGRVTFTGILTGSAKWSALRAASLFVLPSHSEGFSVAVLEALACGVPVLLTRACHFPEVVSAGCGRETGPEEAGIQDCLASLLSLPPKALSHMGALGREFVRERFAWSQVARQTADALDEWMGHP
jgi:glycosyltransferase involved in cell wall biosynthesis